MKWRSVSSRREKEKNVRIAEMKELLAKTEVKAEGQIAEKNDRIAELKEQLALKETEKNERIAEKNKQVA